MELFGTHPIQVCHEWNTAIHVADHEARPAVRLLTAGEVQALFDHADDHVDFARTSKRKGWLALFRDATLFKVVYAYGLRRREAAMLDLHDFTRNPKGLEFGRYGVCNVRWGKASRGSQPRRRAVLTVFDWTRPVLEEYVEDVLPRFGLAGAAVLWPTERQGRIRLAHIDDRFADWRDQLALDPVLASALSAALVCDPSDRGRLRPAVRPAAGRPPLGLDHRALHRGLRRLPQPRAAPCPGRKHAHPSPPKEASSHDPDHEGRRLSSGTCGR